jgi:hypothetical protein
MEPQHPSICSASAAAATAAAVFGYGDRAGKGCAGLGHAAILLSKFRDLTRSLVVKKQQSCQEYVPRVASFEAEAFHLATMRSSAVTFFFLALFGLAACRTPYAEPVAALDPVINPRPKQIVKVFGRIPSSLEMEITINYSADDKSPHPECKPTRQEIITGQGLSKYGRGELLKITRKGERYEGSFAMDKYQAGRCGWYFQSLVAVVGKDGVRDKKHVDLVENPILMPAQDYDPSQTICANPWHETCPAVSNAEPTPVIVRCKMFQSDDLSDPPGLICNGYLRKPFKQTHYTTSETQEVEVNFYDLTVDPDPVASPMP